MSLLGPLDEELNHQTSQPFRVAGTTDHRFYDRHWFEAISPDGDLLMLSGMGIYKNMGVADGFLVVQHNRRQTNVRVSRPLGTHLDSSAGPLTVRVIEPYERVHLSLAPGDYPLAADLRWTSTFPVYLEAPHFTFREGRVIQDTSRYDQVGRLEGWIDLDGTRYESDDWWGVRDHSWGVRPDVGGFESAYGHERSPMLWLWTYAATAELAVHFQLREDGSGNLQHFDGEVLFASRSGRTPVRVERVEHEHRLYRRFSRLEHPRLPPLPGRRAETDAGSGGSAKRLGLSRDRLRERLRRQPRRRGAAWRVGGDRPARPVGAGPGHPERRTILPGTSRTTRPRHDRRSARDRSPSGDELRPGGAVRARAVAPARLAEVRMRAVVRTYVMPGKTDLSNNELGCGRRRR